MILYLVNCHRNSFPLTGSPHDVTRYQRAMKKGSWDADLYKVDGVRIYQDPEYSYVHAMTSPYGPEKGKRPGIPSKGHAYVLFTMFKYLMFQGFCNELPGGQTVIENEHHLPAYGLLWYVDEVAYKYLGFGLHAVMDRTSPAHADFALWDEKKEKSNPVHGPWILNTKTLESKSEAEDKGFLAPTVSAMMNYLRTDECACEK